MLMTVLRNLISNAIKFTEIDGKIWLTSKELEDYIEVSIIDTGMGIDKSDINKLFRIDENFSRSGTYARKVQDLALYCVKSLLRETEER